MRNLSKKEVEKALTSIKKKGYYLLKNIMSNDYCNKCITLLEDDYNLYSPFYASSKNNSLLSDKSMEKVAGRRHQH